MMNDAAAGLGPTTGVEVAISGEFAADTGSDGGVTAVGVLPNRQVACAGVGSGGVGLGAVSGVTLCGPRDLWWRGAALSGVRGVCEGSGKRAKEAAGLPTGTAAATGGPQRTLSGVRGV
jgi:hypothetical protein